MWCGASEELNMHSDNGCTVRLVEQESHIYHDKKPSGGRGVKFIKEGISHLFDIFILALS